MPTPVLLAIADVLYCAGVTYALREQEEFEVRSPVLRDQHSLEAMLPQNPKAIALVSPRIVDNLGQLARTASDHGCSLVLLTGRDSPAQLAAMREEYSAVRGALRKNSQARELLACLREVARGGRWVATLAPAIRNTSGARVLAQLSPRQIRVMSGVSRGEKNLQIAQELGTSEQVVKNVLSDIYDLTGVSDRLELALFVLHHPELAQAARSAAGQMPSG